MEHPYLILTLPSLLSSGFPESDQANIAAENFTATTPKELLRSCSRKIYSPIAAGLGGQSREAQKEGAPN